MKILLDENLPRKLKADFGSDFVVKTVQEMNWLGTKNGELLKLIEANDFDYFVTIDKNLRYQQNLRNYRFSVFLLHAKNNRRNTLQLLVGKIKDKIVEGDEGKLIEIS